MPRSLSCSVRGMAELGIRQGASTSSTASSFLLALMLGACGSDGGEREGTHQGPLGSQLTKLETSTFTVPAGAEVFKCQNLANPFPHDVAIVESASRMTKGSHHMHVFVGESYEPSELSDCSGLQFARTLHSSQSPEQTFHYPEGVGRILKKGESLRVSVHYLNSTPDPLDAKVELSLYTLPPDRIAEQAGSLFFSNFTIEVPPGETKEVTKTCTIESPVNVLGATSHMHQHATAFSATTNSGVKIYDTTSWDSPKPAVFRPPLLLEAGTQVTFTCTYQNLTTETLTFGESARSSEMCILAGTYFPALDGKLLVCT
jgi:hypothetical protein